MALKLKSDQPDEEAAQSPEGTEPAEGATGTDAAAAAPATGSPVGLDVGAGEQAHKAHRVRAIFFWLAVVVALCFIAVIAMQGYELFGYGQPPSVWPAK